VTFSLVLLPWSVGLAYLGEILDAGREGDRHTPSYRYLFTWISLLFELYFVRDLFFELQDPYEVVAIAAANVAKLVIRFPLRMSRKWWQFVRFVRVFLLQLPDNPSFERELEEFREQSIVSFYFLCMAERISLTTFTLGFSLLHHNYNQEFFEESLPNHEYDKLLGFCGYVLMVEWTGSTILTLIMYRAFGLNALTKGGHVVCSPYFRLCALYSAVHIGSDYYASIVGTKWD